MFEEIYTISDTLERATHAEVDALEARFQTTFPTGYREYVTRFGYGSLNNLIQVITPSHMEWHLTQWRERQEADAERFYDLTPLPLPRLLESIILFDSDMGEGVFHPDEPDAVYIFLHEDEHISTVVGGVAEVLDWVFRAGVIATPRRTLVLNEEKAFVEQPFRYFRPLSAPDVLSTFRGSGVTVAELTDMLITFARENRDVVTCVLYKDATSEWAHLFVKECSADVRPTWSMSEESSQFTVYVHYDPTRLISRLEPLLASFTRLGFMRVDSSP